MGKATDTDIAAQQPNEAYTPSLLKAFSVFEQQCQMLEKSHKELKAQLDQANLELEHKNAELARRLAEIEGMKERLSGILESITDAVVLLDDDDSIAQQNQAAASLFARVPSLWKDAQLHTLLTDHTYIRDRDITHRHDQGELIFMVSIVPMAVDKRERLLIIKDVSDYRELLNRVEREDRLSALGHVAANVAHEIRNPLHAIEGFVQLLRRDISENEHACRQSDRILQATRQLNGVVTNLLSYTREMRIAKKPYRLDDLVHEVAELTNSRAQSCKVELVVHPAERRPMAHIDHIQIKQVVTNLITNAFEACEGTDSGCVQVSTGQDEEYTWVQVEDNGCGMTKEMKDRVYEPFYTSKSGGIGLGLGLCRRIVDAHDGRINLQSEPGEGTTFQLLFPRTVGDDE